MGKKGYPEDGNVVEIWMSRLVGSEQRDTQLEQVRVCTKIGIECMNLDPKKRPAARHIIDMLDKTTSSVEIDITSSSFKRQASFVTKQYCQEKIATPSSEYPENNIKECAETEELAEYVGTPREDHWQQGQEEAPGDQWSLGGVQDTEKNVTPQPQGAASTSGSKSGVLYRMKNLFRRKDTGKPMAKIEFEIWMGPRRFSYRELAIATKFFSKEEKLGQGWYGAVYKGYLKETNVHVAVKRVFKGSQRGEMEYVAEVRVISQLRHRNLLQLVGWCHDNNDLLLVYELMPYGSLDKHIHHSPWSQHQQKVLSWSLRHEIVLGLGSALLYLQEDWEQCVLHGDIKPRNLFLDKSFKVKLGDFGLARLVEHGQEAHNAKPAGTLGYMDPELMVTGKPSKESDVYSFGVVVLEIITSRRPIPSQVQDSYLVEFVCELHSEGRILDAVDMRLNGQFDREAMERMMLAALWCVQPDRSRRPSIRQALNVMRSEAPLPILPAKMPMFVLPVDNF
uniref:Uncharacterized protein n=1 Tax=Avena sativa TaxID=4498 RepID=A0ACD5TBC2_AVESA